MGKLRRLLVGAPFGLSEDHTRHIYRSREGLAKRFLEFMASYRLPSAA